MDDNKLFFERLRHEYPYFKGLKDLVIPEGVTELPDRIFFGCMDLESAVVPSSVKKIPYNAFGRCMSIKNVIISSGVTAIGNSAFADCSALEMIGIPDSVTSIGEYAFGGCSAMKLISIGNGVTSVGCNAFTCDPALEYNIYHNAKYLGSYNNPYLLLVGACDTSISSIDIHRDTRLIYNHAFKGCKNLRNVSIPDGVIFIGDCAFSGCSRLISADIPASVTKIGEFAFHDCASLSALSVGNSGVTFGKRALDDCPALTGVTISGKETDKGDLVIPGKLVGDPDCKFIWKQLVKTGGTVFGDDNEIVIGYVDLKESYSHLQCGHAMRDGLYFYREVCMGGYQLENRLKCRSINEAFLLLAAWEFKGAGELDKEDRERVIRIFTNAAENAEPEQGDMVNSIIRKYERDTKWFLT